MLEKQAEENLPVQLDEEVPTETKTRKKRKKSKRTKLKDKIAEQHGELYNIKRPGNSVINELPSKQALKTKLGARLTRKSINSRRINDKKQREKNKVHPRANGDGEMIPFHDEEVNILTVQDKNEQWEILQIIKQLPSPYKIRKLLRDKLFSGTVKPRGGCSRWLYNQQLQWNKTKIFCREVGYKVELWRDSFKSIEGHQGTGVASYFIFMKWLFFLNIFISVLQFLFVIVPQVAWTSSSYTDSVTGGTATSEMVNITKADFCTDKYIVPVDTSSFKVVSDFLQGTGWMEKSVLFYGYYSSGSLDVVGGTEYLMPLAYILVTVVCLLVSLIMMTRHTIQNFRESLLSSSSNNSDYGNMVFAGWDFAMNDEKSAKLRAKSIYNDVVSELEEEKYKQRVAKRSGGDNCKLYTIRFLINLFVFACLGAAGFGIYQITNFSAEFTQSTDVTSKNNLLVLLAQYSPSIVIAALNGLVPLVFAIIVKGEDYSQPMVVKITLLRVVFLRLASVAVLIASIYVTISCTSKDQCRTGTDSCVEIPCWETYVGQAFYKLVIMEFLVEFAVTFFYEIPRKLLTTKCKCNLLQKIGPAEFDVPISVLDLVYLQTLCWLGFFYSPLVPVMVIIAVFVIFYIKKLSALYATIPAQKPYRASKSNSFFMFVLMIAFFMCCVPVGYSIYKVPPSPGCGPFRIYGDMIDIVFITYSQWPDTLYAIVQIVSSTAVIGALLLLLLLIIYYCSARSSVYKEMVKVLQEQLVLDGKDKAFLISKVNELTGKKWGDGDKNKRRERSRRSPSLPAPSPAVELKAVNEVTANHELKDFPPPADYTPPMNYNREASTSTDQERKSATATISNLAFDFE